MTWEKANLSHDPCRVRIKFTQNSNGTPTVLDGTLMWRGTQAENHWFKAQVGQLQAVTSTSVYF